MTHFTANSPGDLALIEPWFNVIRRLRMAAPQNGIAVLSFSVMVDSRGNPVKPYPSPRAVQLEPRACAEDAIGEVLEALVDGNGEV